MKKPKITVNITKEDLGYSAHTIIGDRFISTEGDTYYELKEGIVEAVNLTFEEMGWKYSLEEINISLDLESFFNFYRVINAKALSERIGMNQSLLAQYIKGIKQPSPAQTKRILEAVQQLGKELAEVRFIM